MTRRYVLREPPYLRQAMASLIAMKLEVKDTGLVLYRPLPPELEPVFRRALEQIEAGHPLLQIPELATARAHLKTETDRRHGFGQYKREYRKISLSLAQAKTPPEPALLHTLVPLLSRHPVADAESKTAIQLAHDFAQYPHFAGSEYIDARYLAELEDSNWGCPFWLLRFHESLQLRYLPTLVGNQEHWTPPISQPFDRPSRIHFDGRTFLFTGKFEFGPRRKCREAIVSRGGKWEENMTRAVGCLVVAGQPDPLTKFSNKLLGWLNARRKGWPCLLISEQQWVDALNTP